jgi:predicted ABC-type sugar transport system permease subunit
MKYAIQDALWVGLGSSIGNIALMYFFNLDPFFVTLGSVLAFLGCTILNEVSNYKERAKANVHR